MQHGAGAGIVGARLAVQRLHPGPQRGGQPQAGGIRGQTDTLPLQPPTAGFVWIACGRREFELEQAHIQTTRQLLHGTARQLDRAEQAVRGNRGDIVVRPGGLPVLDAGQTMPPFVYLVPFLALFGTASWGGSPRAASTFGLRSSGRM